MNILTFTLLLLLSAHACTALSCSDENQTFYYADVSTGCQVYHFCENAELKTLTCPLGEAFESRISKCVTASTVICYEILKHSIFSPENEEHSRSKRQAFDPDFLYNFVGPLMKPMVRFIAASLFGSEYALTSKVILPVVDEILDNPLSRRDLFSLFFSTKSAFGPLIWQMSRHQIFTAPEGTIIKVPREYLDTALFKFTTETKPILKRLAMRHLSGAFRLVAQNVPIVLQSLQRLKAARYPYAELKNSVVKFVMKHASLFKTSTNTHVNFYSMPEILNDLMPIKISLFNVIVEYLRRNPNSLLNLFFGRSSLLQRQVVNLPAHSRTLTRSVNPDTYRRNLRILGSMMRRYRG